MDAWEKMQIRLLSFAGWSRCYTVYGLWMQGPAKDVVVPIQEAWAAYDARFRAVRYA